MKNQSVITVKEWFFDKVYDQAKTYGIYLNGEYMNVVTKEGSEVSMLDHTKLRVEEVLCETEKAYRVKLDAERRDVYEPWTAWIPKSVILSYGE